MFTFRIIYNSVTSILIPSNNRIEFVKNKTDDNIVRISLTDKLIFEKEHYSILNTINNSVNRCDKVNVEVLNNGVATGIMGYFSMSKATWNKYKCKVTIQFNLVDVYSCLKVLNKLQVNTIEASGNITSKSFVGTPEYQEVVVDANNFFLSSPSFFITPPSGTGWTPISFIFSNLVLDVDNVTYAGRLTGRYVRINNGGVYSTPRVVLNSELSSGVVTNGTYQQIYELVGATGFPNGRTLENIINLYLSKSNCGLSFRSNFLNINPNGTAPNNKAYQYAANLSKVIVHQKSDVKRPNAHSKASKNVYNFKNFVEQLVNTCNLRFGVEGTTLILEHVSYFSVPTNIIQTVEGIAGDFEYEADQPFRQVFSYMEETSFNFDAALLEFSEACYGDELDTEEIRASYTNNDVEHIIGNIEKISDSGMVFLATTLSGSDYIIKTKEVTVGGMAFLNGHFAWNNLIENLWLYNQYAPTLKLGINTVNADSVRPLINLVDEVEVQKCFSDFLNLNILAGQVSFDGNSYIVDSVKWSNDKMTFKLKR